VPFTLYLKACATEEKKQIAAEVRREREANAKTAATQQVKYTAKARQASLERQARVERTRKQQDACRLQNADVGRQVRLEGEIMRRGRAHEHEKWRDEMRKRVEEAKSLDARLDASEEAQDQREREEGKAMRLALAGAVESTRSEALTARRHKAQTIRSELSEGASEAASVPKQLRAESGELKREQAREWAQQRQQNEGEYLGRARANRAAAQEGREAARAATAAMVEHRKETATHDSNVAREMILAARARMLEAKRRGVQALYRQRFASKHAAEVWESSPIRRLHGHRRAGWSTASSSSQSDTRHSQVRV
jgi:hypothetical protein